MRVLIADDHPLYLAAVCGQIERLFPEATAKVAHCFNGVMAALDGEERIDLLLLDYGMPGTSGSASVQLVVNAAKGAPVVVMSGIALRDEVLACIQAGAKGFLPKTLESEVFASALNVILAGGSYLPAEMFCSQQEAVSPLLPNSPSLDYEGFTEREKTIVEMMVAGKSNKEIARLLDLREVTIKVQLTRIYKKLGAKNRAQAAMLVTQGHMLE